MNFIFLSVVKSSYDNMLTAGCHSQLMLLVTSYDTPLLVNCLTRGLRV